VAELYRPDGTRDTVTPADGDAFTLAELQAFVGGYIEAVWFRDGRVMFVNEDGLRAQLPPNPRATQVAHANARLRPDNVIVGAAVICSWHEAGGDQEDR